MEKFIDLTAEAVEFVRIRMTEIIGEDPKNVEKVGLDIKEAKEQIFRFLYEYQVVRGWPHVAERTARVLGIDRRTVYRKYKK